MSTSSRAATAGAVSAGVTPTRSGALDRGEAVLTWHRSEPAPAVVVEGLGDLRPVVHHERSAHCHRLLDRAAAVHHHPTDLVAARRGEMHGGRAIELGDGLRPHDMPGAHVVP